MPELSEGRYAGESSSQRVTARSRARPSWCSPARPSRPAPSSARSPRAASIRHSIRRPATAPRSRPGSSTTRSMPRPPMPRASPSCASPRSMPPSWSGRPASPAPNRPPRSASSPRSTSSPADAGLAQRTTLMPALDIFSGSAFSMVALTDAINKMPYVPGRIGQLGLFREQGVSTTSVMIEEREGSLTLVETTSRGAPAVQHVANKRKARSLTVPHIALEDTILADEVQNVRAFGSENMLEGVQNVVNQRLSEMASKIDATLEHLRIGAIKGQILDADGSAVIYDLFTEFGVTAYTEVDFDLDNASPAPGAVKTSSTT